jgi:hypothetical protein
VRCYTTFWDLTDAAPPCPPPLLLGWPSGEPELAPWTLTARERRDWSVTRCRGRFASTSGGKSERTPEIKPLRASARAGGQAPGDRTGARPGYSACIRGGAGGVCSVTTPPVSMRGFGIDGRWPTAAARAAPFPSQGRRREAVPAGPVPPVGQLEAPAVRTNRGHATGLRNSVGATGAAGIVAWVSETEMKEGPGIAVAAAGQVTHPRR